MIHADMSVTEFVTTLWENKIKVAMAIVLLIFGPGLYGEWQSKRAVEKREADRQAIDTEASIAGAMLANAWRGCRDIGIVNDMERCAAYEGRLLQEIAAPQLAKIAIERRDSYRRNCQRFNTVEYCNALLIRSLQLSVAQQSSAKND